MATFPFTPFSYNNYYNHFYPHYYNKRNHQNISNINNQNIKENKIDTNQEKYQIQENEYKNKDTEDKNIENQQRSTKYNSFANFNISALLESDLNTPIIEILGIKLYLDDLIIIGLLFFLYKEDVQDEILFGILLLLLLS